MSKIAALPQMKVAWVATLGPEGVRREALGRLEVIADTFLSMGAPAQLALPAWLEARGAMQRQIAERTVANLEALREGGAGAVGIDVLRVEAGWAAVVLLRGWEAPTRRLLEEYGVVVNTTAFYGLADRRMVVVSLLTPEAVFREGVERVTRARVGNQER